MLPKLDFIDLKAGTAIGVIEVGGGSADMVVRSSPGGISLQRVLGGLFFLSLFILILYVSGYRFSGLEAAKAHLVVGKDAEPFGEVDMGWGKVYLLNTADGPLTVGCYRTGILWRCPVSISFYDNSTDAVQNVGWMNWANGENEQITVLAVRATDPRVTYIEAGEPLERVRKNISTDTTVIFNWSKAMFGWALEPVALDSEGHILYEYRLPKNATYERIGYGYSRRWYPASQDK